MRNILCTLRFDGTPFCGYQVQKNGVTIAEKVQDAIEAVTGIRSDIKGCSRTDAKVHANMYCLNFHTASGIPCDKLIRALNMHLPYEIAVYDCREVADDFHARYHCKGKEYMYLIHNHLCRQPFLQNLAYEYRYSIDTDQLNQAGKAFIGTHDFKSFCSVKADVEDTTRTVSGFGVLREGEMVKIYVAGDGFLFNMVRIMVGTLLWISQGRLKPDAIPDILAARDRSQAGVTAPAHGLYLNKVLY